MFLSCTLLKPQRPEVYALLSQRGSYNYLDDYKLYVTKVEEQMGFDATSYGKMIDVYYDEPMTLKKINEKTLKIEPEYFIYTEGPKTLYFFYKEPLSNMLGIFASGVDATKISRIIAQVIQRKHKEPVFQPLLNLEFKLKEKEDEINKIEAFADTVEVRVSDIRDTYLADFWMKGTELNHSDEYNKLIRDPLIGGTVEYMAINFRERTYYLFSDGRIFTRQATADVKQEIHSIFMISKKLFEIGALVF